jgi:parallel beta-helix repeat protein
MTLPRHSLRISCVMIFSTLAFGASEVAVNCGDTLTDASVTYVLTSNLNCTTNPAVTITADNIRFDLQNHKIHGSGTGTGIRVASAAIPPIPVLNAHVHGGTVQSFAIGIGLQEVNNSHIEDMKITDMHFTNGGSFSTAGILVAGTGNLLDSNDFENDDAGILLISQKGNILTKNRIEKSSIGILASQSGGGVILANTISSGQVGIELGDSANNVIQDCVLTKNGIGILVLGPGADQNLIRGNTATDNTNVGIAMGQRGIGNTLTENTAARNGTDLFDFGDTFTGQGCVNTWLGNTFKTANKSCIH